MEINNALINGVFLILGVLLSAGINYLFKKQDQNWNEAKQDIKMLAKQCESFYHLENSYLHYINMISPKDKPKTVQSKRRLLLTINPKLSKININPNAVDKLLAKWNILD